jgi:hypothetical protein
MAGPPDNQAAQGPPGYRSPPWLWLRWLFLAFGLIFLVLGCEEIAYDHGGIRVEGVVVEKHAGTGKRSRPGVKYRFKTQDGRTIEGICDVLSDAWSTLRVGGPVAVDYLPGLPHYNRIPGQRAGAAVWAIMTLALLAATIVVHVRARRVRLPGRSDGTG